MKKNNTEPVFLSQPVFNPVTSMSDQDKIFPFQYQYHVNQISDENKEKYQFEDNLLIQY